VERKFSALAAVDMNHIPGSDGFGCLEQRGEDWLVGTDFIAGHVSYDGPEAQLSEVVLMLEFAVDCNETSNES